MDRLTIKDFEPTSELMKCMGGTVLLGMYEKLAHYEDLEEAGRLVVLPSGVTGEQLCKIVNACPSILGLKNNCGSHSCESCWEAALKGGGQDE